MDQQAFKKFTDGFFTIRRNNKFNCGTWSDMVIESTNKYGEKLSKANRPHKKNARASTFKPVDLDEIKRFLGICLLGGAVKFSVIRDMFSQNQLYYHPIFNHTMSGRRFDQILNCFSVQYTDCYNNEVIGPMMKVQPLFDTLIKERVSRTLMK